MVALNEASKVERHQASEMDPVRGSNPLENEISKCRIVPGLREGFASV